MAGFLFRLQPALDRAYANEALARAVIIDARSLSDAAGLALLAIETRLNELVAAECGLPSRAAGSFAAFEAARLAMSALLRQRRDEVERAQAALKRARGLYASIANERGALERLRERRRQEHRRLAALAELAAAEETNSLRSSEGGYFTLRRSDR